MGDGDQAEPTDAERIGALIACLRRVRGLTQAELARRSGMKRPNLSRLERGGNGLPKLGTLAMLAAVLDVEVSYLVSPMDHEGVVMAAI